MNRFSVMKHYPAMQPLAAITQAVRDAGRLEDTLVELVLMRVSQINGCAFCLDMHSKDARVAGETEQRLYLLPAWRETKLYSAVQWRKTRHLQHSRQPRPDLHRRVQPSDSCHPSRAELFACSRQRLPPLSFPCP